MREGTLNVLIGGPAGAGIEKSGKTLTTSFVRGGYFVFANVEHMSQIRGGNNYLRIRVDKVQHQNHIEEIDIMVAMDRQTIEDHIGEMSEGGVVIYDNEIVKLEEGFDARGALMLDVPMKNLAVDRLGTPIMANVIALGIVCGLTNYDIDMLKGVLAKTFAKKGEEIIKLNEDAAQIGYDFVRDKVSDFAVTMPVISRDEGRMFLMGNDAFCIGAIKAGVKFIGEYPMTPSSSILHFMARWGKEYGIVVKHVEDEIAACASIIGAGFAGVRALTGTSGGGFALMGEAIGLAAMNEVPIVVCNVMRPGPATGLPTRSEQGDLRQVIHAGQGDPVKIVLLPGSVEESAEMGFDSFNLAEKYQLPVIVTYDKYAGEAYYTCDAFDFGGREVDRGKLLTQAELDKIDDYQRYLHTEDGISPRVIPGMKGGTHRATSDEHNEHGEMTEDGENRTKMVDKRLKKVELSLEDTPKPMMIGDDDAEITFVTWGSAKAVCMEAVKDLGKKGVKANILQIRTAWPFHTKGVKDALAASKRLVLVEHNATAQMGGLIAEHTGVIIEEKILRYDGLPMTSKYILDRL